MTEPAFADVLLKSVAWREPVEVLRAVEQLDFAVCLLSGQGVSGGWSYVAAEPDDIRVSAAGDGVDLVGVAPPSGVSVEGDAPPIQGGWLGLITYEAGADVATGPRATEWPDLILARYPAMLAFDHAASRIWIIGRGEDADTASLAADRAAGWLDLPVDLASAPEGSLAEAFNPEAPPDAYAAAVSDVVGRIASGELFQANIARAWTGALAEGRTPLEVFEALAASSPADYAAYWRLADGALVSNSPEQFLKLSPDGRVEARPIKGTRPRGATGPEDVRLALELIASPKDRAENLMIVDLMRNDLSRVCAPGSVEVERLCDLMTLPSLHHLVSTVSGRIADGAGAAELLEAAFPPGSITGAPKHQAMKVIAEHEAPRGPWCGALALIGFDGSMSASVLIRTLAFRWGDERWRFRTQAGAGIVADSDPQAEMAETEAKIRLIRETLTGAGQVA